MSHPVLRRRTTRPTVASSPAQRRARLRLEQLEERTLLSAEPSWLPVAAEPAPLRLVLVNDTVAQAAAVAAAAEEGVVALRYDGASVDTAGLVDLVAAVAAAQGGARVAQLGIVAHGSPGQVAVGADTWSSAHLPAQDEALARLAALLTDDARLDLYACSAGAEAAGQALVARLAARTGADVFASDNAVGSGDLGDFTWEVTPAASSPTRDLLDAAVLERVVGLRLEDAYEPNDSKLEVDGRPEGGANSANLGLLTTARAINGLALEDSADWFKFRTATVGTTAHSVQISFDRTQGDADLYVYRSDGTTVVGESTNYSGNSNGSSETVDLTGERADTFYIKVVAKSSNQPNLASYSLLITPPPAGQADDVYEENDSKPGVDARPEAGANSPNLGLLTTATTISNLVLNDADDWFKFRTATVGTTAHSVQISFDRTQGDVDLYVYRSDGTTVAGESTNYSGNSNGSSETVELTGERADTFYIRVRAKYPSNAYYPPAIASYALTITPPPAGQADDVYEDNDTKAGVDARPEAGANSPNLGLLTTGTTISNLILNDSDDWFKFRTATVGTTAHSVQIAFDRTQGDIDLYVYRSDGVTVVDGSTNYSGNSNGDSESVGLTGERSGTFYIRVRAKYPSNAYYPPAIAAYTLTITPPPAGQADDVYEENDSKAGVDARPEGGANSPNLGQLTANTTLANLILNDAEDWFRFSTVAVGTGNHTVQVTFDRTQGDLDLYVYRSDGVTVVDGSTNYSGNSNGDSEVVDLGGEFAGVYYIKVVAKYPNNGYYPPAMASYTLSIAPPTSGPADDPFENNDSKGQIDSQPEGVGNSPNLGQLITATTLPNLILNDAQDWFRFRIAAAGTAEHSVQIAFDRTQGDIDLYVYRSDGTTLVDSSTNYSGNSSGGTETVSLEGEAAGTYYAKIVAKYGNSAYYAPGMPDYSLTISPPVIPGVVLRQTGGDTQVAEGGATDSYTAVLTTRPSANVTITLAAGSQLRITPTTPLVFTPSDWNVPQTVTVTAVDDNSVEGTHTGTISHTATSSDPVYHQIAIPVVTATISDNDIPGVAVSQTGGNTAVNEAGGSDSYTLVLLTQPTANVTISILPDGQVSAASTSVVFTPSNWNAPQTVVIQAADDAIVEASPHTGRVQHSAASGDPNYHGLAVADVPVAITDNDTPQVLQSDVVTAPDAGGPPLVRVYRPNGQLRAEFHAYGPSFQGGVRIALADVTGDGAPEVFTAPGPTGSPFVNVFDGATFAFRYQIQVYGDTFRGGVNLTVADVLGTGTPQLITAPDVGGQPYVNVFHSQTGQRLTQLLVYGETFTGGVRLATADVNNDLVRDILVAPQAGGAPFVNMFNARTGQLLRQVQVYGSSFNGGLFLTTGDINGDRVADLIVGPGSSGQPYVNAFDVRTGVFLRQWLVYGETFTAGVRVSAVDVNQDNVADILTGPGPSGQPYVKVLSGLTREQLGLFLAYAEAMTSGLFVVGVPR